MEGGGGWDHPQAKEEPIIGTQEPGSETTFPEEVNKAETCLLGTLFLTEEQDPRQKAPAKYLEVSGISLQRLLRTSALTRPPPQGEHYLAGA